MRSRACGSKGAATVSVHLGAMFLSVVITQTGQSCARKTVRLVGFNNLKNRPFVRATTASAPSTSGGC